MIRGTINPGAIYIRSGDDFTIPVKQEGIRQFETGATRDTDDGKLDFDGFLSPFVLESYAEYMHKHRHLPDGSLRPSDNWKLGLSQDVYMKSLWRHFFAVWKEQCGITTPDGLIANLNAVLFNAQGMLHEILKAQDKSDAIPQAKVDHFWKAMEREAKERFSDDFQKEDRGSGV